MNQVRFAPTNGSFLITEAYRPSESVEQWGIYLDGVEARYSSFGVSNALDRAQLEVDGCEVFWLVWAGASRSPVGGIRAHGPIRVLSDVHALVEMASSPGFDLFVHSLGELVRGGVVELKGAWTKGTGEMEVVSAALSRCCQHSLWLLGARFGLCTTADHSLQRWRSSGAELMDPAIPAALYPTTEYRTVPLVWDVNKFDQLAIGMQARLLAERVEMAESVALKGPRHSVPAGSVS